MAKRLKLPKDLTPEQIERQLREYPKLEEELARYRIPITELTKLLDHWLKHDITAESDADRAYIAQEELLKGLAGIQRTLFKSAMSIDQVIAPALKKVPLFKVKGSVIVSSPSDPNRATHPMKVMVFPRVPPAKEIGNLRELVVRLNNVRAGL